jgi:predicted kinase
MRAREYPSTRSGAAATVSESMSLTPSDARTLEAPPPPPLVVALIGLPGAGKSVVAKALAQEFGLHRVCRDELRHAMFPQCSYSYAEKRAAFRALLLAVEVNCALGRGSVIDGVTFSRRRDLERLDATLAPYRITPLALFLDCPPETARVRVARDLATGRHPAADRSPDLVDEIMARFDPPPPTCVVIDAAREEPALIEAAIAAVRVRAGR